MLIITTTILYGIFVSAKSYHVGLRRVLRREYGRMLVHRVTSHKLPLELVDIIFGFWQQLTWYATIRFGLQVSTQVRAYYDFLKRN